MCACILRDRPLVKKLLRASANPNLKNADGMTALMYACSTTWSPKIDTEIVQTLIESGVNINSINKWGENALMGLLVFKANRQSRLKIIEKLIESGININKRTKEGYNALSYAIALQDKNIVVLLIKAGVKINKKSRKCLKFEMATPYIFDLKNEKRKLKLIEKVIKGRLFEGTKRRRY